MTATFGTVLVPGFMISQFELVGVATACLAGKARVQDAQRNSLFRFAGVLARSTAGGVASEAAERHAQRPASRWTHPARDPEHLMDAATIPAAWRRRSRATVRAGVWPAAREGSEARWRPAISWRKVRCTEGVSAETSRPVQQEG